jgi:anti-anti-sigma factor
MYGTTVLHLNETRKGIPVRIEVAMIKGRTVAPLPCTDIMDQQRRPFGAAMATPRTQLLVEEMATELDGGSTLRVRGELDISTADQLRREVGPYLTTGSRLVLDLSQVTFCDSTGLAVLVGFHKRLAAAGGGLELYAPAQRVLHLLTITGLNRVFRVRAAGEEPGAR